MEVFEILAHCALPPERCAKVLVSFANYQDRGSAPEQTLILASKIKKNPILCIGAFKNYMDKILDFYSTFLDFKLCPMAVT